MASKTIIYLTDNSLSEPLATRCREILAKNAGDIPIVSVSQKPLTFGRNVCVGEIGRSWMSIYKQILAGLEVVETPYIAIAEHDCFYVPEHLNWTPPIDDTFYYNTHHWLVEWGTKHPEINGMYSFWKGRIAFSQLICNKELFKKSTNEVMNLIEQGVKTKKGMRWQGEPGVISSLTRASEVANSGQSFQLQQYLKDYLTHYKSETFNTVLPNLDVRHESNFTGGKRGKKRRYDLPFWGSFSNIMKGVMV